MEKITVPILLVGFNRPHCIRKVLQQLQRVQPENLYISIDAPRENRPDDIPLVESVKRIVKDITWECNVRYRFFENNVGAEVNVSSGVKWVLEENEYVIVNEDDIYAGYSFYKFEQDMLIHHKDDNRIGIVSGLNLSPYNDPSRQYLFSKDGHIWGWGTWKRVWKDYRLDDIIEDEIISVENLTQMLSSREQAVSTHRIMKQQQALGQGNNTWDYMFWYYRLKKRYYGIVPSHNLLSNIGVEGLHARGYNHTHFTPRDEQFQVTTFRELEWDKDYDEYNFNKWNNQAIFKKLYLRLSLAYKRKFVMTDKFFSDFFNS